MKEQLHTIPIADAFAEAGECPFCYIEKHARQRIMDFVLGSQASYMEADIRDLTDRAGFCREHFKQMFDYGNSLGNAWILKTHYMRILQEFNQVTKDFHPNKASLLKRLRKGNDAPDPLLQWINEKQDSCYICDNLKRTFDAYMETFFELYRKDPSFVPMIQNSKGFCLTHFEDLCKAANERLSEKDLNEFYDLVLPLMRQNLERLLEDVSWFVEKYDYKNRDADWKDSKDAIQRGMQKLKGGYPADPPYMKK